MKARVQAVLATGTFLRFFQMMLPKGTTETRGRREPAGLWENLKGQDRAKYLGMGSFKRVRQTGWQDSRVRILRNRAEDVTGR